MAVPGQLLVRFAPRTTGATRDAVHRALGARVARSIPVIDVDVVHVPTDMPMRGVIDAYRALGNVRSVERNVTGTIALSPGDACHTSPCDGISGQWHHLMTNTPFGWDLAPTTSAPVTIAVLDTVIDRSHPDWVNADGTSQLDTRAARDWVPASRQDGAARYHGTFVAGLAAAATGNGRDVAGVALRTARIMPLTVVDGSGMTNAADLADAIIHAWRNGARVINLSLGLTAPSDAVRAAIQTAAAGTASTPPSLVVAAAGNNTGDTPFYPGSYPESMSIGGTDRNDRRAACANHNDNISVSAPADRLIGLQHMPGRLVQAPCGTSAATPQVSGLAALLFAQDPSRTPAEVRAIIERTADDLGPRGRDEHFGHGRINIERALAASGPHTSDAATTVVGARGGTSTITARARGERIAAAEAFVGSPTAAPITMAVDGDRLRAATSVSLPAGTHPVWVRARDEHGWGPASVTTLAVDGAGPVIWGASARDAIRATASPLHVSFGLGDDHATTFTHAIEVRSSLTNAVVHREVRSATAGGTHAYQWLPPLDLPGGHYRISIGAVDEVGNTTTKELGALIT